MCINVYLMHGSHTGGNRVVVFWVVCKVATEVSEEHTAFSLDDRYSVLLQCICTHLSDYIVL